MIYTKSDSPVILLHAWIMLYMCNSTVYMVYYRYQSEDYSPMSDSNSQLPITSSVATLRALTLRGTGSSRAFIWRIPYLWPLPTRMKPSSQPIQKFRYSLQLTDSTLTVSLEGPPFGVWKRSTQAMIPLSSEGTSLRSIKISPVAWWLSYKNPSPESPHRLLSSELHQRWSAECGHFYKFGCGMLWTHPGR